MNLTTHARLDNPASESADCAVHRGHRPVAGQAQAILPPEAARTGSSPRSRGTPQPLLQPRRDRDALTSCPLRDCTNGVTCLHHESP